MAGLKLEEEAWLDMFSWKMKPFSINRKACSVELVLQWCVYFQNIIHM